MYERFVQLLQENDITAYRVSKDTGVTQTTLSDWKTGRATPRMATLKKIADYFKVSLDWLTGNSECRSVANIQNNGEQLTGIYFKLGKEAQELGLDEEDIENILNLYRKHRKNNE